ncbi:MAG: M48 family metalloprotease [Desulfobacula sp.]|nr:M48 family metalloprotease [Desulfobacula sp.]
MKIQNTFLSVSRRQFLKYGVAASALAASPFMISGCAIDPVTGKKQLMMVSAKQEIGIDKQNSPHQFSSDYGITQDKAINRYVSDVGKGLLPFVHRPEMPYNFNCVNANYINAYAFPGGTIGISRGILLQLDNEAQLASLIGHELGHINARHSAEQMSKGQLSSILVGGLSIAASTQGSGLGELTQQLGMLGQGLLLSKYSRDNEREADYLGNEYMVRAGYPSAGFVDLMEMLNSLNKEKPSSVQILFSTHPMSSERLNAALYRERGIYAQSAEYSLKRDRYMDRIASLRADQKGIELLQVGEKYMAKKQYDKGQQSFKKAIKIMPGDYTAHVLTAKAMLARKKYKPALLYANKAQKLYSSEAQAYYIAGFANLSLEKFDRAYKKFDKCDHLLPGNPQVTFYKGFCLDKNGDKKPAAQNYIRYLKTVRQPNKYSRYAYIRLKAWGYAN